jgi:adenosine deaminase
MVLPPVSGRRKWRLSLFTLLFCCASVSAQTKAKDLSAGETPSERRTARSLESARANPLDLRAFLLNMPKGGDLHNHLVGAIYAESWIREAVEDKLCVDLASYTLAKAEASPAGSAAEPVCAKGGVAAALAYQDQHLYDELVDAFSMRGFVPTPGATGHDHFFDAFAKFRAIDPRHLGEWLDEVSRRAAAQNEQYLELMYTPDFSHSATIAKEIGWSDDLGRLRDRLLERGLRDDVAAARAGFDQAERDRSRREHCGQLDAAPACGVEIRYLYQILRGFPKEQVFAQTLLGFESASADSRVVGINFVMPEDGYISMADYDLHMRIVGFLHGLYPKVHISLHAGELAPGLVPPEGLCCHIRLAVEQAHAERIGHGVDVMHENEPYSLLREMAAKHVMVEINFTSNDVILGVRGKEEPFPIYRKFSVPVALSTDDEGVSRIDLTNEYVRAVETYGLRYEELKKMARTSLEHSFLPGSSLWRDRDSFRAMVAACANGQSENKQTAPCATFLKSSERARQQWELEQRFDKFESEH